METLLSRYRSVTVLLIAVVGQLILLAWQVKTNQDVRLIRVWAVTAVTPVADIVEAVRRNTIGFLEDYFILLDVREQNRRLQADNNKLKLENHFYKNELATAERARALAAFQPRLPSKTVAARVTGNATVSTARAVFIDRGSTSGIEKGMAVVTPDGLVGKVIAVYPLASQILLVTDPTFSVGVESNNHVRGTLNCKSSKECTVDYVQNEEKVQPGDTFYTSGEDRVFPKGFPAGTVISARPGQLMKDVRLVLSTPPSAAEEVLVILEGVHQAIPDSAPRPSSGVTRLLPPPPPDSTGAPHEVRLQTEADKIKERYVELGAEQNHVFGAHGSSVPNFNLPLKSAQPAGAAPAPNSSAPAAGSAANQTQTQNPPNASAGANTKSTAAPAAKSTTKTTGPVLPLGAPRRKPDEGPPQ
jgi:rod shape-determining protein MreC